MGGYFKLRTARAFRWWALWRTESTDAHGGSAACNVLSVLQMPSSSTTLVVRSDRDPQELVTALQDALHTLDAGLPFTSRHGQKAGQRVVRFAGGHGVAGRAGYAGRNASDDGHLRDGGVLGEQAAAGAGHPDCAGRTTQGGAAHSAGARRPAAGLRSVAGWCWAWRRRRSFRSSSIRRRHGIRWCWAAWC